MATLKAQADKEQSEFESEWKELGKMIEQVSMPCTRAAKPLRPSLTVSLTVHGLP